MLCCSCWLSTWPEKEFRVESRNEARYAVPGVAKSGTRLSDWTEPCSGKSWWNRSSDNWIFPGADFMSSYVENTKIPHGNDCSSWLAESISKKICAWLHVLPLHQNHIYTGLPRCLFGAVSQSYLRYCLLGYSPRYSDTFQLLYLLISFIIVAFSAVYVCFKPLIAVFVWITLNSINKRGRMVSKKHFPQVSDVAEYCVTLY